MYWKVKKFKKQFSGFFYRQLFLVKENIKRLKNDPKKKTFGQILDKNRSTKIRPETVQYCSIYPFYFEKFRDKPISLLEIGVQNGGSIKSWQEYFPKAMIYGLDINDCRRFENKRAKIFIGDQSDSEFLNRMISQIGHKLDIIIDDGGHTMKQQKCSFSLLFPGLLKKGGIYVIEDLHTSYAGNSFSKPIHQGGKISDTHTTTYMLKQMIDSVNHRWCLPELRIGDIDSIHCHDGIAFIKKLEKN